MESEADRAAFYQAHKDDPEVWDEPERVKRRPGPPKRLSDTITVRFSSEETDLIRREARRTESNYSEVIRQAVRRLEQPWTAEITMRNLFMHFGPPTSGPPIPADFVLDGPVVSRTGIRDRVD